MLKGLLVSVLITMISMIVGSLFGVLVYQLRVSNIRVMAAISAVYIEIFRNVPLLVILYLVYFGLPEVGINFDPFWAAVFGMSLNNAAYVAEIARAGFGSVPAGLNEAGRALGMNSRQTFLHVMLVPAIRGIIPALTNQFILLFLFSSVASVISLPDLTYQLMAANSQSLRTFEVFTVGLLLYYAVSSIIAIGSRYSERLMFKW